MKTFFANYFYYSKNERRAALVLLICCGLLLLIQQALPYLQPTTPPPDFSKFEAAMAVLDSLPNDNTKAIPKPITESAPVQLFAFDPNTATEKELLQLGIRERTVQTLLNYRNKGGRFYQKEDLQKIYGLSENTYQALAPFIQLTSVKKPKRKKQVIAKEPILIDVNQATAEQWQQLRGIGPYYAKRIVRFREKLGGFSTIEQIGDTYHLPDSTFKQIQPFLKYSPIFKQLAVNSLSTEELADHPYLSFKEARAIVNYRDQHGAYSTIEKVQQALEPLDTDWNRLHPYISLASP